MEEPVKDPSMEESKEKTFEVIKPDTILEIKMGTGYYRRIQDVTSFIVEGKSVEELQAGYKEIADQNVTTPWVRHYETMLILCKEFETTARDNGHVDIVTEDVFLKLMDTE